MILTPSIESAFICGDENAVGLNDISGLGLVSFMFDSHSSKKNSNIEELKSTADMLMGFGDEAYILVNGEKLLVDAPKLIERSAAQQSLAVHARENRSKAGTKGRFTGAQLRRCTGATYENG